MSQSQFLFILDNPDRWSFEIPGVTLVAARKYLSEPLFSTLKNCKVFNLCKSYKYQSAGYYVSLLAEARGHRPLPKIATIQDLKFQSIARSVSADLHELIQKSLVNIHTDSFSLSVYFSRNLAKCYDRLSKHLFNLFPAPLLRVLFKRNEAVWHLETISAISSSEVPEDHRPFVAQFAKEYFSKRTLGSNKKEHTRYYMGILVDKNDPAPPSNEKAIQRFVKAAEELAFDVEIISKDDYGRLGEFDAVFIRQTTAANNHTYRFARKAEAEGTVVIDDPQSIVRCTNKVFLAEMLERYNLPMPKTVIVHKGNQSIVPAVLGFPVVLKQPDSAFSQGVMKANNKEEFDKLLNELFEKSDLLIAQEFLPSEFDWRIGILDNKPLFACKYYMARNHWQIYNHAKKGASCSGRGETVPIEAVPTNILNAASKAAKLMGNGLYGVDLKEIGSKCYVIEVNDNPNIDFGIEDKILKDELYRKIMEVFLNRLITKREGKL
jgi:glutathione synthase/RimK-type ligase-like ATP-grasp enzyme